MGIYLCDKCQELRDDDYICCEDTAIGLVCETCLEDMPEDEYDELGIE